MVSGDLSLSFSITPFYITRQFYYALEEGLVDPDGIDLAIEYNHSPVKDQVLLCGDVDATTISMGKYILAKTISDTYTIPVDPFALVAALTCERGEGTFVRDDSGIERPADLSGKRVGIHDKSMVLVYHQAILEETFGVSPDDIEWVFDTHQGLTERMAAGDIDAVERVGDWYWNLHDSDDHTLLYDMGEEWHGLTGQYPLVHLIGVDRDVYVNHPAAMDAFVAALRASGEYRDENYGEILEAFVTEGSRRTELTGERRYEDLERITRPFRFPAAMGDPQRENVRDWMDYAVRYGVLSDPVPEERLYPLTRYR